MLHTTPTQTAVCDLEQRGPGARTIAAGLAIAALLAVVYVGRAEVLMMPALGMIAVTAAAVDARTLRIPNWLTGTGAVVFAVSVSTLSWWRTPRGSRSRQERRSWVGRSSRHISSASRARLGSATSSSQLFSAHHSAQSHRPPRIGHGCWR